MTAPRRLTAFALALLTLGGAAYLAWPYVLGAGEERTKGDDDGDDRPASPAPPQGTARSGAAGPAELHLDAAALAANGIRLATLTPVLAPEEIRLPARVLDPAPLIAAREAARNAAARLAAARARKKAAEAALARDRALYRDHQNIAAATLEEAESAAAEARAAEEEADAALEALRARDRTVWGEALARELEADTPLAAALCTGSERLIALAWPADHPPPAPLPPARFLAGEGNAPLPLLPLGAAPAADPATATQDLYYHASHPLLLPGLKGTGLLAVGPKRAVFTIPPSAVVWWQGKAFVYRALAEGRFARLALDGARAGDEAYVLPAREGESLRIVSEGAAVLLSEEFRGSIDLGEDDEGDP